MLSKGHGSRSEASPVPVILPDSKSSEPLTRTSTFAGSVVWSIQTSKFSSVALSAWLLATLMPAADPALRVTM